MFCFEGGNFDFVSFGASEKFLVLKFFSLPLGKFEDLDEFIVSLAKTWDSRTVCLGCECWCCGVEGWEEENLAFLWEKVEKPRRANFPDCTKRLEGWYRRETP